MPKRNINIEIPYKLAGELSKKIKESGFDTIAEYVVYILEQTISEEENNMDFDEKEEKNVRERLKEMGYL